ncbi:MULTISPECIES: hypothetical protein [Bacteria]
MSSKAWAWFWTVFIAIGCGAGAYPGALELGLALGWAIAIGIGGFIVSGICCGSYVVGHGRMRSLRKTANSGGTPRSDDADAL